MDETNFNSQNIRNVPCECESSNDYHPVDFLGDSVCKVAVKEIVKKYEPDKEVGIMTNTSSGYGGSGSSSFMMANNHNNNYNSSFENALSHASMKLNHVSNKRHNNNKNTISNNNITTNHMLYEEQPMNGIYASSIQQPLRYIKLNYTELIKNKK